MVKKEKQIKRSIHTNFTSKDMHLILTYKSEVEPDLVKKDVLEFLNKMQKTTLDNFLYCYSVKPILDKLPAVHILLRPNKKLNQTELLSIWDKGIAKAATITAADKGAMEYYLTKWGGRQIS